MKRNYVILTAIFIVTMIMIAIASCGESKQSGGAMTASGAAEKVYVAPGEYDEFYAFMSGGFSGQVSVYGLPSGRLFRVIPVFSQDAEKGYGYSEETKNMLMTSWGFIPWDDAHHPQLSRTNGVTDGRWLFINGNNTPRIARIDLTTFETAEIIEIPNSGGNHPSPYVTDNTEYLVAGARFSVPIPQEDVSINEYKEKFKGTLTFIKVEPTHGTLSIAFQLLMPGFDYDLATAGKGKSNGWSFFTSYNVEQSNTLKEVNASQLDKDFITAVNWKKAEEYIAQGKGKVMKSSYYHNVYDEGKQTAISYKKDEVLILTPEECPGVVYYIPTPKSPHGVDVDPTGHYIVGNGKLSADMSVFSFDKMIAAIEKQDFETTIDGIPVLKYESVLDGIVLQPGLGPLHTEFDGKGFAYTTFFISSEIVKWKLDDKSVVDRVPCYYSVGHLMIPGGDSREPYGKYVIALNKITKDRYLPTGPELAHSAQLYDISGNKMELLLDFPTIGEPHYAQAIPASKLMPNSKQIFKIEENNHEHVTKKEADTKVVRKGDTVRIYMTTIRSHFAPDNIEGIKVGDKVFFHVTNLEQDWDVPHGFSMMGARNSELLIMPGQTRTLYWEPTRVGVYPFYCTDFCSALHQEMQGYIRISPAGSNPELKWWTGD